VFLQSSAAAREAVGQHATELGLHTVLAMMQVLDQTIARLRYSAHGRVLAELALVRICQLNDLDELAALIEQLKGGDAGAARAVSARAGRVIAGTEATSRSASAPAIVPTAQPAKKKEEPPEGELTRDDKSPATTTQIAALELDAADALAVWRQALARLEGIVTDYASQAERVALAAPDLLVVTFVKKYNSSKRFCEQPHQVQRIEQALAEIAGRPLRLSFALAEEGDEGTKTAVPRPATRDRVREKAKHPLVSKAMELFDARPVRVDDPRE
jgi:DNA polymerase III subunit gamma/tau